MFATDRSLEPIWWAVFYVVTVITQSIGGKFLGKIMIVLAILMELLMVLWLCLAASTMKEENGKWVETASVNATLVLTNSTTGASTTSYVMTDVPLNSGNDVWFHGGMVNFLRALPTCVWLYIGAETAVLGAEEITNFKPSIVKGMLAGIFSLMFTGWLTVIFGSFGDPGRSISCVRVYICLCVCTLILLHPLVF